MSSTPTRSAPPRDSIGGTSATQILGVNKYGGKHAAYRKLVAGLNGSDGESNINFQMYRGIVCENPVVDMVQADFFEDTGMMLGELFGSGVVRHPDYNFIHATIDRVVLDKDGMFAGILEIKTVGRAPGADKYWWRHETGSPDHRCQLEHYVEVISKAMPERIKDGGLTENYLLVAEADEETWSMAVRLVNSGHPLDGLRPMIDIQWIKCNFSGHYGKISVPKLVDFWTNNVEKHVPPPIDGSDDCAMTIMDGIPSRSGSRKINEDTKPYIEIVSLVHEFDHIKIMVKDIESIIDEKREEVKELKRRQAEIKNTLADIAGENEVVESGSFRIKVSRSVRGRGFDSDKFKIENPDEWLKYQKSGRDGERVTITLR